MQAFSMTQGLRKPGARYTKKPGGIKKKGVLMKYEKIRGLLWTSKRIKSFN